MNPAKTGRFLVLILKLVAVHSAAVCIAMMFVTENLLSVLGFQSSGDAFFRIQAGVFHLVMAIAYWIAAMDVHAHRGLVLLTIIAKSIATLFLLLYYFLVDPIVLILLSGIGDGVMGAIIMWLYVRVARSHRVVLRTESPVSSETH